MVDDITNAKEKENVEQVISMVTSVHTPLLILFGQDDQVKKLDNVDVSRYDHVTNSYHIISLLFDLIHKFTCVIINTSNKWCDVFSNLT